MQAYVADFTMYYMSIIEFDDTRPTLGRKMIGVILWSDAADQKAVIWCEDQGDLAFLANPEPQAQCDAFFAVGDVVEFDVQTDRNMRLANNAIRVRQNQGPTLTDGLLTLAGESPAEMTETAEIIPFRIDHATRPLPGALPQQQRRG
ncbi:hypothetical protein [uncultured Tateyamaria sp.]|uniref:hypothetical protein n=1 Tax=uncultured Tateyamaria sp. TaxID=455651 RepID=UPI00260CA5D3|nr:hypothetical protein [uncultured Tateyamaria sp.]